MIRSIALLTAALLVSSPAIAEMNIVVLDTVRAILETEEAKVLISAAEKEMEAEQTGIRELAEQRQTLGEKIQKDREVMSQTEQRNIQKDIEDLEIDLQFRTQKLQKEVQDRRQEILVALAPQFEKVRNDLIEVEGYDMIIAPNAMIYVNPKNDITRRVTERMNEKSDD
ncbi:MAG: outer membrane protein [Limisphaerales bacterium]|jgi:outer membrane protein